MALSSSTKAEIINKFQLSENDCGSSAVQVALLSADISSLTEHLKVHRKDFHSRRGLIAKVSLRRKHLDYMKRKDFSAYSKLIQTLGIRR